MNPSTSLNGSCQNYSNTFTCMIEDCPVNSMPVYQYLDHLSNTHKVPRSYRYKCTFQQCCQVLSNWYTFKRHTLRHADRELHIREESTFESDDRRNDETFVKTPADTSDSRIQAAELEEDNSSVSTYAANMRDIQQAALEFTLDLHSETNMARNDIQNVQKKVTELNRTIAEKIKSVLPSTTNDSQSDFELNKYFQKLEKPFDFIETDFKLFKYLEEMNIFRLPIKIKVGDGTDEKKDNLIVMDIEFQLKAYFNTGDILTLTINNTNKLEKSDKISSIVNGDIWQRVKQKYPNDVLLPLSYYSDDFEINDPLSAHNKKHVICGSYYSCPTIPEQYSSKLNNIFVACMMKKVDINETSLNTLLRQIVQRFKEIEERGILFEIDGRQVKVRFILVLLQGDNLGLHQMLNFLSFNANYYCRFCRRTREECQIDVEEYETYRRTIKSYEEDVNLKKPSETGIKGETAFNELPSFHVVINISVDPMHDFYSSGVCSFGLTAVMNYCIYQKRFVSLSKFNSQKTIFSKNTLDSSLKRMGDINETYLSNQKCKSVIIRATASEIKAFIHYFPLLMGPFVPKDDEVWEYCKNLVKLSDKALSPSFTEKDIQELQDLCKMHHIQYQKLFNESLKPKQHFVCHYGSVIRSSGSISRMMNFRYEAKHKEFKEYARIVTSRQNICFTLCIKAALQFSNELFKQSFFQDPYDIKLSLCKFESKEYFSFLCPPYPFKLDEVQCTEKIKFKGTEFKVGFYVTVTEMQNISLYEIIDVLIINDQNEPYIVRQLWEIGDYDNHFLAYEVISKTTNFNVFGIVDVDGPPINVHYVLNKTLFRKKTDFLTMDL